MIKQKQYDWKDSNLALFGSDTERQVKSKSIFFFFEGVEVGIGPKKIDFQYSNAEYELKVHVCALQRCKYVRGEMITFIFCMLILFQSFLKRFPLCSKLEKNVNGSMSLLVDNLCYIKYFNLSIIIIGVFRL